MLMRAIVILVWVTLGGAGLGYMLYDMLGQWGAVLALPITMAGGIATGMGLADTMMLRREREGRIHGYR